MAKGIASDFPGCHRGNAIGFLVRAAASNRGGFRSLDHLKQTQRSERCTAGFLWTFSSPDAFAARGEFGGSELPTQVGRRVERVVLESAQPIVAQPPATTVSVSRNTGRDQRRARRAVDDCRLSIQ